MTYSYSDDAYLVPTAQRRRKLLRTKCFTCHCKRCDAQDYCRPLPCPTPNCTNYACLRGTGDKDKKQKNSAATDSMCSKVNGSVLNDEWVCVKCGPVPPPELAQETEGELLRILNELNEQVRNDDLSLHIIQTTGQLLGHAYVFSKIPTNLYFSFLSLKFSPFLVLVTCFSGRR